MDDQRGRRLLWHGFFLLLLGLFTGLGVAMNIFRNPRQGLSAHLIGIMDAGLLGVVGLAWKTFDLSNKLRGLLFWSAVLGLYLGWMSNLLSAVFGTSRMTPLAGEGFSGQPWQENVISLGLVVAAVTMITMCVTALWGLRGTVARFSATVTSSRGDR